MTGARPRLRCDVATEERRLIAMSDHLKCVYGLLQDPRKCISRSGGFEMFLHEYGGAHNVEGEDGGVVEKGEDDDE